MNPVYYFLNPLTDSSKTQKEIVYKAVENFANKYYKDLQKTALILNIPKRKKIN